MVCGVAAVPAQERVAFIVSGLVTVADRFGQGAGKSNRAAIRFPAARLSIVLMMTAAARTIGELRSSGHVRENVKQEMRRNLLTRLRSGEPLLPGIVGYDETVLPQLANAVISGHDVILLGERGQA